jgi:hypothetical protein
VPGSGDLHNEVNVELSQLPPEQAGPAFDAKRVGYLNAMREKTGRPVFLYATAWLGGSAPPEVTSINLEDIHGLMEVSRDVDGPALDVILHSPGGQAKATASIVRYLRSRFKDIRVYVPLAAMSAATMWALAADRIVMGKHSQLGPIDPQLLTPQGPIPARAILDQFEKARAEVAANPASVGAYLPMLQQYGPALLQMCENAEALAERLVGEWLEAYMLARTDNAHQRADEIAHWFNNHQVHRSHGLGISRDQARQQGVTVDDLEDDPEMQDLVLSIFHLTSILFSRSITVKLIENHLGRRFMKQVAVQQLPFPLAVQPPHAPQPPPGSPSTEPPADPQEPAGS